MNVDHEMTAANECRKHESASSWIEFVPAAVILVASESGRMLGANALALRMYGYSREEMSSLSIRDLRMPDTHEAIRGQMALADTNGIRFETFHRRKDGVAFPVEVSSNGARIGDERVLLSVVRDLSERRRKEADNRRFDLRLNEAIGAELGQLLTTTYDDLDDAIIEAQRRMCRLLGMDRSAIWQGTPEAPTTLGLTHLCTLDQIPSVPDGITTNEAFPLSTAT